MNPLITIFNGRIRTLGQGHDSRIYLQVDVTMRSHLHLLKGAPLGVFLCIALHTDQDGWAYPSIDLICTETGYTRNTVFRALDYLVRAEINGHRLLLRTQQANNDGTFSSNRYLIFPTKSDLFQYESHQAQLPSTEYQKPVHGDDRVPKNGIPKNGIPKSGTLTISNSLEEEPPGDPSSEKEKTPSELWGRVLKRLESQTTRATFNTWLRYTEALDLQESTLTVKAHNVYAQQWLQGRLLPQIERVVAAIAREPVAVRFVVKEE